MTTPFQKGQFGFDLNFLKGHIRPVILSSKNEQQQLIIAPEFQSRIMTSTSDGLDGTSFGWINYDLIASGKKQEHIHAYGGEDRIWLGPEAGQFGIFFLPGKSFNFENYFVPEVLDTAAFQLVGRTKTSADFSKDASLTNYSAAEFHFKIERSISLLDPEAIASLLQINLNEKISWIGFESRNKLVNTGSESWKKESGLLSVWILGIQKASDESVVIIPIKNPDLKITTEYFGELNSDRLMVKNNAVFFKADGNFRSKIGIPFSNSKPVCGSFDPFNQVMTIVQFSLRDEDCYVNSLWKIQDEPYRGDVINSYNDGPLSPGETQLGKFHELETSSPARELKPGEDLLHVHRTFHFKGNHESLNNISRAVLDVDLNSLPFTR